MLLLGIIVISCLTTGVILQHHGTEISCLTCDKLTDENACRTYEPCHEHCITEVKVLANGDKVWSWGCKGHRDCEHQVNIASLIGKRAHHHDEGQLVCKECCDTTRCNANLCANFKQLNPKTTTTTRQPVTQRPHAHQPPTVAPTTSNPTTAVPTTAEPVVDNSCHNDESTSFHCSELDKYNFCTDTTSVAYAIAHDHCAKYCGFCGTSTTVTTPKPVTTPEPVVNIVNATQVPCADIGDPVVSCMELKSLGFCNTGSGTGHTFAELRCRETCGMCG